MRKHLLWATTVLTSVLAILIMVSDLAMRSDPETYANAIEAGADPRSWDLVGTIMLGIWLIVAVDFWRFRWRVA